MASQWIPQNLQKRLLRYALEQLSLFSEIDLQKLDVSFGTSAKVTLQDVEIDTDKFNIPGIYVRNGRIDSLTMTMAMSDGVNIVCDGIHVSLTPSPTKEHRYKQGEFSLARSTAELARSAAYDDYVDDDMSDMQFVSTLEASIMKNKTLTSTNDDDVDDTTDNDEVEPFPKLSGVMQKAAEYALSKLHIQLKNIIFTILTDSSKIQVAISAIIFSSSGDSQDIQIEGIRISIPSEGQNPIGSTTFFDTTEKHKSSSDETLDSESDTDEYNDVLMSTSFMSNNKKDIHPSLIQSVMRSHKPTSTVYMSAETEFADAKSRQILPDEKDYNVNDKKLANEILRVAYIDNINASFAGLQDICNLKINIGTIRITTSPLPEVLDSLLAALVPKKSVINVDRNSKDFCSEERKSSLIESMVIHRLEVAFDSSLNANGDFDNVDSPIMMFRDLDIQKKSENYYFGHIVSLGISRNKGGEEILGFLRNKPEQPVVEMEIEISNGIQLAFTLPFHGNIRLEKENLISLVCYYHKCEHFINILRSLPSKKSSSKSSSDIIVRTAQISLNYALSVDESLILEISPIRYSSRTGLVIKEAKVTLKRSEEALGRILLISQLNYDTVQKKKIKGYTANGDKTTTFNTDSELRAASVELDINMDDLRLLNCRFREFKSRLESLSFATAGFKIAQLSAPRTRSVKIANSLFLDRHLCAEISYKVQEISLLIRGINSEFGDVRIFGSNLGAATFRGKNSELYVENLCVTREKQGLVQPFIKAAENSHTGKQPLIFVNIGSGITAHVRSCRLDYYGIWLTMFENAGGGEAVEEQAARALIGETKQPKESSKQALKVEIIFTDTSLGLTPIHMPSHCILFIKKGNASIHINNNGMIYDQMSLNTISIFLIDDRKYLSKKPKPNTDWTITSWLKELGYVYIGACNSVFMRLKMGSMKSILSLSYTAADLKRYHSLVDVKLDMDKLHLYLCADSFSCFTQLCNDLKEPLFFTFDEKYKIAQSQGINTYSDVDDDFFSYKNKDGPKTASSSLSEASFGRTNKGDIYSEPLNITEDFYGEKNGSACLVDSGNTQHSSLKSSRYTANELSVQSDHFERASFKAGKPKIIPMSITLGLRKVEVYMYDGYEWKETRKQITEAIKRVQKTASITRKIPNEGDKSEKSSIPDNEMVKVLASSHNSVNPESSAASKIVEETLFQSIHLGIHPGESLGSAYNRVNQSINPREWTEKQSWNTTPNMSKKSTIDIDIKKSSKNYKDLRLRRSETYKVKIVLNDIDLLFLLVSDNEPRPTSKPSIFCEDRVSNSESIHLCESELVGRLALCIGDLHILDNAPSSSWNMFLGYMREAGKREFGSSIMKLNMDIVRPVPELAASELRMSVSILPLRMYVDQDTLEFLVRFTEFHDSRFSWIAKDNDELFLESVQINPVQLKLDYKPKKVDFAGLRSGHTDEFMNFFMLEDSNMVLRQLNIHGVSGFGRLQQLLRSYWMPDIKQNQLGDVLAGVTPIKSLVKIGSGFKSLAVVPVKEYRKDGRALRSLEKGATSFGKTTGGELLRLGVKLANGTQTILENMEMMLGGEGCAGRISDDYNTKSIINKRESRRRLSSVEEDDQDSYEQFFIHPETHRREKRIGGSDSTLQSDEFLGENEQNSHYEEIETILDSEIESEDEESDVNATKKFEKRVSLYANPPESLQAGMKKAYKSFGHNINLAQRAFSGASTRASEHSTTGQAALEYAKAAPAMLIRPLIGTTEAISRTLLGGLSELDPEERNRSREKYKKA